MVPYPLLLEPILKPRVWGGRTLGRFGKRLPANAIIGESWEVADLPPEIPDGQSVITNGALAGSPLGRAVEQHAETILGAARDRGEGFPLLVKYLDAQENLSVQVHPDEAYARSHPGSHLKSEAWYVVEAVPGAVIYKGLEPDVTADDFLAHIERGTVVDALQTCPVAAGDCHYISSGTCHALGAGILVAEIQTPSDTTFRLFDWGRTGRELHLEQALQCIQTAQAEPPAPSSSPPPFITGAIRTQPLVRTPHFVLERLDATAREAAQVVTNDLPEVWMMLAGSMTLQTSGAETVDVPRGTTVLLPAALSDAQAALEHDTTILRITLPSPLDGLLAQG